MTTHDLPRSTPVLITGGTGMVGAHLASLLLAKGYHNLHLTRRDTSPMHLAKSFEDRVKWISADIRDPQSIEAAVKGKEIIIHCAALIAQGRQARSLMHDINARGTRILINAALEAGVRRFLHVSSISVFTRTGGHQVINEQTEWQPTRYTSEYGLTKYLAEMEVWRGGAEGLEVGVINPSIVMGPGIWDTGSYAMFARVYDGLKFYPRGVSGFVDVRDVALMLWLLLEQDILPAHRILLNAENMSYEKMFSLIARHLDKKPPSIKVGAFGSELLWRLSKPVEWFTGRSAPVTRETARTTSCLLHFENQKSLNIPGFTYRPIRETVADTCAVVLASGTKNEQLQLLEFGL